jgi:hypothetical protein
MKFHLLEIIIFYLDGLKIYFKIESLALFNVIFGTMSLIEMLRNEKIFGNGNVTGETTKFRTLIFLDLFTQIYLCFQKLVPKKQAPAHISNLNFKPSFLTLDFEKSQYFKKSKYLELEKIAPFLIYPVTWFKKIYILCHQADWAIPTKYKKMTTLRLIFGGEETGHLVMLGVQQKVRSHYKRKCRARDRVWKKKRAPDTRVSFNFTVHLREMVSGWEYPTSQIGTR